MSGVATFPGKPLVSVLSGPGRHVVMLARPGAVSAEVQSTWSSRDAAEHYALAEAALHGWNFIGVFDDKRLARIADWRRGGDCTSLPSHVDPGPSAT